MNSTINSIDSTVYDTIYIGFTDSIWITAPDFICGTSYYTVHGPPGFATYQWYIDPNVATVHSPNSQSTGISIDSGLVVMELTITDHNGCMRTIIDTMQISDTSATTTMTPVLDNDNIDIISDCGVTPTPPTASDNLWGKPVVGTTNATFPITAIGTTNILWTFTDEFGNFTTQTQTITITPITPTIALLNNSNILAAGPVGQGYTYQWYDCHTNLPIPGATAQTFQYISGTYAVEVSRGPCTAMSECVKASTAGINNFGASGLILYPNPVSDILFITYPDQLNITLYNAPGEVILNTSEKTLDISDLAKGVYYLSAYDSNGKLVDVRKVIKE